MDPGRGGGSGRGRGKGRGKGRGRDRGAAAGHIARKVTAREYAAYFMHDRNPPTTEASKKTEEKGNRRTIRHTNPRRSSDRRGEADASTILLLERRGRCWINIMPVVFDRSLSHGPLLPPLLPREKNPNASRARSLHSSQRKHPPHALDRSLSLSLLRSLTPSLAPLRKKP